MVFKLFTWSEHGRGKSPDHLNTITQLKYNLIAYRDPNGGAAKGRPPLGVSISIKSVFKLY